MPYDYFEFPITAAEALDQYRLKEEIRIANEAEKKLREEASRAIKAANAMKKSAARIQKRVDLLKQKTCPAIYGVRDLSPALQAEWKAHEASGKKLSAAEQRARFQNPVARELCIQCAPNHAGPFVDVKPTMFSQCTDCERYIFDKVAKVAILSEEFIARKLAERAKKKELGDVAQNSPALGSVEVAHQLRNMPESQLEAA